MWKPGDGPGQPREPTSCKCRSGGLWWTGLDRQSLLKIGSLGAQPHRPGPEAVQQWSPAPSSTPSGSANTFNLRSTRAGSGYGQGQHDQGERPAGVLALGWIGGLGRIAVAPFGVAGGVPGRAVLAGGRPAAAPRPPLA